MINHANCFEVDEFSFRYPSADADTLSRLTMKIRRGATTAIVGLSGSGKTTLLAALGLLSGTTPFSNGSVVYRNSIEAINYRIADKHSLNQLRMHQFGFVLQSAFLLPHFSCLENVAFPLAIQGVSAAERLEKAMALLASDGDPSSDLSHLADKPARQTSGGERQRLALYRALIHAPQVIFADEPLNNLDFINARFVTDRLMQWKHDPSHRDERTLILVSHDLEKVFESVDEFFVISHGRLIRPEPFSKADLPEGVQSLRTLMREGGSQ